MVEPDESPQRDRPEEERVPLRLGALDKVSLEQDEKTELEREKEVRVRGRGREARMQRWNALEEPGMEALITGGKGGGRGLCEGLQRKGSQSPR